MIAKQWLHVIQGVTKLYKKKIFIVKQRIIKKEDGGRNRFPNLELNNFLQSAEFKFIKMQSRPKRELKCWSTDLGKQSH